ncbi:MAG: urease accessory UreF family protein [Cyanobacteriota bacterium]|nr:urease accessory UreF family protein [Cyanobacteriota bacterium]
MTPDALQRLHLLQLVSPALPVGAFSYSEGVEVLVQQGRLADGQAVEAWLRAELRQGSLMLEAASLPVFMEALVRWREDAVDGDPGAARAAVLARDSWLLALREAPEVRAQQRQMGGTLLRLLADLGWPLPPDPAGSATTVLAWTAAWAWALVALAVPVRAGVEAYLYGWVANQLSAAVRLVPLGPTEAQRIQLRLAPWIAEQAEALARSETPPEERWSGGVGAALAQLGHGELYSRLFRS